ncbi:MAG TPA: right-handed parallel beta-helix repeat-containing protein, partial [Kineosporiaceae bacterium]|nr:right-handed parallel beta-helix repeat-containing protein [Kineosporiaceae bacterium]
GGPAVGAGAPVVVADDASPLPPGATVAPGTVAPSLAPSSAAARPAPSASASPSASTPAGPSTPAAPGTTGGTGGGTGGTGGGTRAAGTPIPKGAVVVGSGRAAGCTGAALRSAVAKVVRRGSGTVSFDCGRAPVTIAVDRPLAFTGSASSRYVLDGRGLVTLDGRDATGLVTLPDTAGLSATFRGLVFTRARTATQGAAIHGGWRNRILVEDSTFTSNTSTSANGDFDGGGAMYVHEGTATVRRSTFRGNSALNGGAIQNTIGDLVVENSTFSSNSASVAGRGGGGGAIYSDSGSLVVRASTISGNTAVRAGGGLFVWNAKNKTSRIEGSTITGNRMLGSGDNGFGAGIRNGSGPLVITDSTISRNVTYSQGGGLYNADDAAVTIKRTRFVRNKAGQGGALFRVSGSIATASCTFSGNTPADVR